MKIEITKINKDLPTPRYAHTGDAGMDIYSAVDDIIEPGQRKMIPTGIKIAVPYGFEAQVRPRSGLAAKHGITVLNTPGTIDHQYRGEVCVILANLGNEIFAVKKGERIAQLIFNKIEIVHLEEVDALSETMRGAGGFGSTGFK